ncbi:hypothetical protein BH10BDE1_BH10BDE1_24290 [soil metagenome]
MPSAVEFNYFSAFSRNRGWLTEDEQKILSTVRVGILGAGGVGGQYAEILTRLGVQHFVIWDPDQFAMENSNRQNECRTSNYGKNKADVIAVLIRDINPNACVEVHVNSMSIEHVESFCRSIDFYFDGLDFFEIDVRIALFRKLRELGISAVTVAPIATGSSALVFTSKSMSFDNYFGFHTTSDPVERSLLFITGVTPTLMQRNYIAEKTSIDFAARRVPSLAMGVCSASSLAATTFLKIILQRGPVSVAPWSFHYDPYLMKVRRRYTWWGYRNPVQRLKRFIARIILKKA